jgi:hypothetical protein
MAILRPLKFLHGTLTTAVIALGSAKANTQPMSVSQLPVELTAPAHSYINPEAPAYVPASMLTGVSLRNAVAEFSRNHAVASAQIVANLGESGPASNLISFATGAQFTGMVFGTMPNISSNVPHIVG